MQHDQRTLIVGTLLSIKLPAKSPNAPCQNSLTMKRSRAIQLTLVTSMASLLVSCDNRPARYCVDNNQVVTDDKYCEDPSASHYGYRWYYGGSHGPVANGTHLTGGSYSAPSRGFTTPSGESGEVSTRGVIGSAGEAASGGHGGEGAGE
jgi:hypothetical protein